DDAVLPQRLERRLPDRHQLRDAHSSALVRRPAGARRGRRDGRRRQYVHGLRLPRARRRHESDGGARRAARSHRRAHTGSACTLQRLPRAPVRRQRAGARRRRAPGQARRERRRRGRQSDPRAGSRPAVDERERRARVVAILLEIRPGRLARGPAVAGRAAPDRRMARHRRSVLQRPVRRADGLTVASALEVCALGAGPGRAARAIAWLAALAALALAPLAACAATYEVIVEDPYLELHTGPGRGYPVFQIAERGERVELIRRRTDWFQVRLPRGEVGWVPLAQL